MADTNADSMLSMARDGNVEGVVGALDAGVDLEIRGSGGETLLMAAGSSGNAELVKALVARKATREGLSEDGASRILEEAMAALEADITAVSDDDETTAFYRACQNQFKVAAEILAGRGADIKGVHTFGDQGIHVASQEDRVETVEWLNGLGVDFETTGQNGNTCLLSACFAGASRVVRWLVEHGANAAAQDDDGDSCLHLVINDVGSAELLIAAGAGIDTTNMAGKTALHHACTEHVPVMVRWLVGAGADIQAKDIEGRTPLHWAAETGNLESVESLIRLGADMAATDNDGRTAAAVISEDACFEIDDEIIAEGEAKRLASA